MMLSILICSLESRSLLLVKLLNHLENQRTDEVNILTAVDNKQVTTGAKRNNLVQSASGKYIVFIDDDDWVPDYYVREMLRGCSSDSDCLAINGIITTDGRNEIKWRISKDYDNETINEGGRPVYLRRTNHITAVKREFALLAPFPDKSNAEDKGYSDEVVKHLKTEFVLDLPMYHYIFSKQNKEYK